MWARRSDSRRLWIEHCFKERCDLGERGIIEKNEDVPCDPVLAGSKRDLEDDDIIHVHPHLCDE